MTYTPGKYALPIPPVVCAFSDVSLGHEIAMSGGFGGGAQAWPSANRAIGYPLYIGRPEPIKRLWLFNQTVAGNFDIGVYDEGYNKIWASGSTAMSGGNTIQSVTPSPDPLVLAPGRYYMVMAMSSTSATVSGMSYTARFVQLGGAFRMDSSFPLGSTLTPAAYTDGPIWCFGVSTVTTL